ncbi:hypothetical protein OE699_13790 [Sedimentimonas flavescens]|uniref:Pyocin activator protein PrtN n=2 Tax=Sedimentimonas flavescens TaxID=2851012 RepID=A0ABT3A1P5_9RHOB|nr:hypothetical protein [Sedimentimonas flavescens]
MPDWLARLWMRLKHFLRREDELARYRALATTLRPTRPLVRSLAPRRSPPALILTEEDQRAANARVSELLLRQVQRNLHDRE